MKCRWFVCAGLFLFLGCGGGNGGPNGGDGDPDPSDADQADTDLTDTDLPTDGDATQCTQGARRCDGVETQTCQADGSWLRTATCPYVCQDGQCVGECGPGSQRCCRRTQSGAKGCGNQYLSECIGAGCGADDPVAVVFIETCGLDGKFGETNVCELCSSSGDIGFAACNACSFAEGARCAPAGGGCGDPCQ